MAPVAGRASGVLAWSRSGLIVFVPPAASCLSSPPKLFSSFLQSVDGISWELSEPALVEIVSSQTSQFPITSLDWDAQGINLALTDQSGRLLIFSFDGPINRLVRRYIYEPPSTPDVFANELVGFKWCSITKVVAITSNTATRQDNNEFHYSLHKLSSLGPTNPVSGRGACVGVSRNGRIHLWIQSVERREDSDVVKFQETSRFLESNLFPEEYYSIAAFGADRDESFILAVYSQARHVLKVFRITIQWNLKSNEASVPESPFAQIHSKRLHIDELYCPAGSNYDLSHLEVVSPTIHPESRLTIHAIHSSDTDSIVQQIEVVSLPISLHSNFDALGLRKTVSSDEPGDLLQLKETHIFPKRIINFDSRYSDSAISIAFADGSVELRDQDSFTPFSAALNSQRINNLFDVGFDFPSARASSNICLSPNTVAFVSLSPEGVLDLHYMQSALSVEGSESESSLLLAVALAQRHTVSSYSGMVSDDLLLIACDRMRKHSADFAFTFINQTHKSFGFSLDYSREGQVDKLLSTNCQKLLSLQAFLGMKKGWKRSPLSLVAWYTLNLRLFSFAIMLSLKGSVALPNGDLKFKGDMMVSLLGLSKWCVDFMVYLVQEIFEFSRSPEEYLSSGTEGTAALVMLLGSMPRVLLRYALRGVRGLEQMIIRFSDVNGASEKSSTGGASPAFRQWYSIVKSAPIPIGSFERLVTDVDAFLKSGNYKVNATVEQTMLFHGRIPDELREAAFRIRTVFLDRLKPELEMTTLYFYDVSWLRLDSSPDPNYPSSNDLDGLRKCLMDYNHSGDDYSRFLSRRRRCVRCGSVSSIGGSDSSVRRENRINNWTYAFSRGCLCGSPWVAFEKQTKSEPADTVVSDSEL
ncbi:mediator complex, subunit Med16 [Lipomyces oligophaga]|uniref:mediator complex, subunit Med16 n=1 Tax=Lipomyces oligophaga TaxID=45792 RepID=UPI0034CF08FC